MPPISITAAPAATPTLSSSSSASSTSKPGLFGQKVKIEAQEEKSSKPKKSNGPRKIDLA